MTAIAIASRSGAISSIAASSTALLAFLEHYGFDHFLRTTLSLIDMKNKTYADAVDKALTYYRPEINSENFSIKRALIAAVSEVMDEEGCSREEALEIIADDGYVVPVNVAMYYSADTGDGEEERLSELLQLRARKILERNAS